MKNTQPYSRRFAVLGLALSLCSGSARIAAAQQTPPPPKERIGTYDSRSVAVAFAGSSMFAEDLKRLMAARDKARTAGDSATAEKIEAEGRAMQITAHKQAFSTAPVDEILARMTNALPGITNNAGVSVLISKWDEPALKQHPGAERVDVTLQLIDAFHPSERQRKNAIEIQKHKPISIEDAARISD